MMLSHGSSTRKWSGTAAAGQQQTTASVWRRRCCCSSPTAAAALRALRRGAATTAQASSSSCCPRRAGSPPPRRRLSAIARAGPGAPDPDDVVSGPPLSMEEVEEMWRQLTLTKQRLDDAVAREDFAAAARLRDAAAEVSSKLPPVQRYVYSQLERLRGGGSNGSGSGTSNSSSSSGGSSGNTISVRERRDAIAALGAAGSAAVIPELAAALHDASLSDAAHAALWAVFCRAPDPEVGELMAQAEPLLHAGGDAQLAAALALYDEAAARAPRFAEARNKRATALYLLRRYDEAVAACREALELNPHHFGAASGMGLCYWSLRQPAPALEAFEAALAIHPGLSAIRRHVETLREEVEAARRTAQQQPGQQQQQQPGQQSAEEQ